MKIDKEKHLILRVHKMEQCLPETLAACFDYYTAEMEKEKKEFLDDMRKIENILNANTAVKFSKRIIHKIKGKVPPCLHGVTPETVVNHAGLEPPITLAELSTLVLKYAHCVNFFSCTDYDETCPKYVQAFITAHCCKPLTEVMPNNEMVRYQNIGYIFKHLIIELNLFTDYGTNLFMNYVSHYVLPVVETNMKIGKQEWDRIRHLSNSHGKSEYLTHFNTFAGLLAEQCKLQISLSFLKNLIAHIPITNQIFLQEFCVLMNLFYQHKKHNELTLTKLVNNFVPIMFKGHFKRNFVSYFKDEKSNEEYFWSVAERYLLEKLITDCRLGDDSELEIAKLADNCSETCVNRFTLSQSIVESPNPFHIVGNLMNVALTDDTKKETFKVGKLHEWVPSFKDFEKEPVLQKAANNLSVDDFFTKFSLSEAENMAHSRFLGNYKSKCVKRVISGTDEVVWVVSRRVKLNLMDICKRMDEVDILAGSKNPCILQDMLRPVKIKTAFRRTTSVAERKSSVKLPPERISSSTDGVNVGRNRSLKTMENNSNDNNKADEAEEETDIYDDVYHKPTVLYPKTNLPFRTTRLFTTLARYKYDLVENKRYVYYKTVFNKYDDPGSENMVECPIMMLFELTRIDDNLSHISAYADVYYKCLFKSEWFEKHGYSIIVYCVDEFIRLVKNESKAEDYVLDEEIIDPETFQM